MQIHLKNKEGLFNVESIDIENQLIYLRKGICTFKEVRLVKAAAHEKVIADKIMAIAFPVEEAEYKKIFIPKKSGGVRTLYMLRPDLAIAQKKEKLKYGTRFISVYGCVTRHRGCKTIINLDMKSAFENINIKTFKPLPEIVQKSFNKDGFLMQGTPLSNHIFEWVHRKKTYKFIGLLYQYAYNNHFRVTVTRYVDDITISSKDRLDRKHIEAMINIVRTYYKQYGQELNEKKTRVSFDGEKHFKILSIDMSQGRLGVRHLKKKCLLCLKHGNIEKARGIYAYIQQFLEYNTSKTLKEKLWV